MTFGEYRRAKPRLRVMRAFSGNESLHLSSTFPVDASNVILSGQVMYLGPAGTWLLGCPAGHVPFFAIQDSVDTDVVSVGRLTGLSCADNYMLQTGYFNAAQ